MGCPEKGALALGWRAEARAANLSGSNAGRRRNGAWERTQRFCIQGAKEALGRVFLKELSS